MISQVFSDKRKSDLKKTKWGKRLALKKFILAGNSFNEAARKFGTSPQASHDMWKKIEEMEDNSIEYLERMRDKYEQNN